MRPSTPESDSLPIRVAVDLTPLLPGGENGGVKHFIFEYLSRLGSQSVQPLQFVFLTRQSSHGDVRPIARFDHELICILPDSGAPIPSWTRSPRERLIIDPPDDLLVRLKVDLLYTPFSQCRWQWPGTPTMATAHDTLHRDYPATLDPQDIAARESMLSEMGARADLIQCNSEFTMGQLSKYYHVPKERMFRSSIAIHKRLRLEPGSCEFSPNRPYFFYPANAWKHKNHQVLLIAFAIYRRRCKRPPWDLVLTGHEDSSMRSVMELAETLGVAGSVRYLGHLTEGEYSRVWANAGALVFPSLYEGFGIPLVEAMAFSLPIISSMSGSLPEVGGNACIYVDARRPEELSNAMARVSGDAQLRTDLGRRSSIRLEAFSFRSDVDTFLNKLSACARSPARLTVRGLYPDRWTTTHLTFNSPPNAGNAKLRVWTRPMPWLRTIQLRCQGNVIAERIAQPETALEFEFDIFADGRVFSLAIPDASRPGGVDLRVLGILIERLVVEAEDGQQTEIITEVS